MGNDMTKLSAYVKTQRVKRTLTIGQRMTTVQYFDKNINLDKRYEELITILNDFLKVSLCTNDDDTVTWTQTDLQWMDMVYVHGVPTIDGSTPLKIPFDFSKSFVNDMEEKDKSFLNVRDVTADSKVGVQKWIKKADFHQISWDVYTFKSQLNIYYWTVDITLTISDDKEGQIVIFISWNPLEFINIKLYNTNRTEDQLFAEDIIYSFPLDSIEFISMLNNILDKSPKGILLSNNQILNIYNIFEEYLFPLEFHNLWSNIILPKAMLYKQAEEINRKERKEYWDVIPTISTLIFGEMKMKNIDHRCDNIPYTFRVHTTQKQPIKLVMVHTDDIDLFLDSDLRRYSHIIVGGCNVTDSIPSFHESFVTILTSQRRANYIKVLVCFVHNPSPDTDTIAMIEHWKQYAEENGIIFFVSNPDLNWTNPRIQKVITQLASEAYTKFHAPYYLGLKTRYFESDFIMDDDTVLKDGYINKQGAGLAVSWKKRWLVLHPSRLVYYTDESKKRKCGDIQLSETSEIMKFDHKKRKHVFQIKVPGRHFLIQGASQYSTEAWIDAVNEQVIDLKTREGMYIIHILVMGPRGTGKSCIINHWENERLILPYKFTEAIIPRTDEDSLIKYKLEGIEYTFIFEESHHLESKSENYDIVIYVMDLSQPSHLIDMEEYIQKGVEEFSKNGILIGNKADVQCDEITEEQCNNLGKKYNLTYLEISAKEPQNDHILELVLSLVKN